MGFRTFGFPPACHPSYGVSALPPAGLTPAEHISLFWTHNRACDSRRTRLSSGYSPSIMPLRVSAMDPLVALAADDERLATA